METPFSISYHNIKLQVKRLYKSADKLSEKQFPGLEDISFFLKGGECVHLDTPVPSAHRLLLDALTGHTRIEAGAIWIEHQGQWLNLSQLPHRQAGKIQASTIGYLGPSDALCSEPTAMDCVLKPLIDLGLTHAHAEEQSRHILDWVGLPRRLWYRPLRKLAIYELHQVNLARTFSIDYSVIVIDLSISGLDQANQKRLMDLIEYRKARGTCFIGRFDHDDVRQRVCDRDISIHIPTPISATQSKSAPTVAQPIMIKPAAKPIATKPIAKPTLFTTGVAVSSTAVRSY